MAPVYVWQRGRENNGAKGFSTPQGSRRTILTYMKNVCTPLSCGMGDAKVQCGVGCKMAGGSCRTSSYMWRSWNLPHFMLWEGSLTLMNMASLMVIVILSVSLPIMEKLSRLIQCYEDLPCLYMREGTLMCFLNLLWKVLPDSPVYSFVQPGYMSTHRSFHFLCDGILVLWGHQKIPDNVSSLKMNLYSEFITNILSRPFRIGDNYADIMGVVAVINLESTWLALGLTGTMPVVGPESVASLEPMWTITPKKGFPDVVLFFLQHL